MARRVETDLQPLAGSDLPQRMEPRAGDDDEAREARSLLDAAMRRLEEGQQPDAKPAPRKRRKRAAPEAPAPELVDDGEHGGDVVPHDPVHDGPTPGGSALEGVPPGPGGLFARVGINPWSAAALLMFVGLATLSLMALNEVPKPLPVSNITLTWLPGPRVPDTEVVAWLKRCPQFEKLNEPNDWVLEKLADHLRALPAVAEVRRVRLFHEPGKIQAVRRAPGKAPVVVQIDGLRRTVEIQLALRQPYLPAVLRDGSRAWIAEDGTVLPGILPGPGVPRPLVRQLEAGGAPAIRAAVDLWQRLEPQVERGLVSDVLLNEVLDPPAALPAVVPGQPVPAPAAAPSNPERGIVLATRQGARLVWGRPGEEKYGVLPEDKARDLVHTLRCQGDLSRILAVNVRFHEPFYQLR